MKKAVELTYRILLIVIFIVWISLIVIEYHRYQKDLPMLVVFKEEVKTYDDGYVKISVGLGYKSINYDRASIKGKEFGHLFIKERQEMPNK